jgi:hypothetical protein
MVIKCSIARALMMMVVVPLGKRRSSILPMRGWRGAEVGKQLLSTQMAHHRNMLKGPDESRRREA